eukprot:355964-Chlamydomonas_euryale.AAC.4
MLVYATVSVTPAAGDGPASFWSNLEPRFKLTAAGDAPAPAAFWSRALDRMRRAPATAYAAAARPRESA